MKPGNGVFLPPSLVLGALTKFLQTFSFVPNISIVDLLVPNEFHPECVFDSFPRERDLANFALFVIPSSPCLSKDK